MTDDDYIPHTEPWPKQAEAFELSKDAPWFALFMEPRTGKSKVIIDTAARLYLKGIIQGLLIIAWPNGVHRNWITDEIPAHLPPAIAWRAHIWRANRWKIKWRKEEFEALLGFNGLRVLAVNAEALKSEECRKAIGRFAKSLIAAGKSGLAVGDETMFMQSPKSRRAKVMDSIGKLAVFKYKRILDGMPISNMGPFGLYAQFRFLDRSILGHDTYTTFKSHYATMELQGDRAFQNSLAHLRKKIADDNPALDPLSLERLAIDGARRVGRSWVGPHRDELTGEVVYRNLDELRDRMAPYSFRCTFAECFRDVPRPVYQKKYFQLSSEQRRVYDDLRDQYRAELHDASEITADMVLVRYLRLQQVTSNFLPPSLTASPCHTCEGIPDPHEVCEVCDDLGVVIDKGELRHIDPTHNPRLESLKQIVAPGDQWLIWARFNQEVDEIVAYGRSLGLPIGQYDGRVDEEQKAEAKDNFQKGHLAWLVGKQTSMGRGIPLWKARGHIFMSNFYSLDARIQSERRTEIAHRRSATEIIDLVAEDTIDDTVIIPTLRSNHDVALRIMGDPGKEWI